MRLLVCLGVLALVVLSLADKDDQAWEDFKAQHKRSFSDPNQEKARKGIFLANANEVNQHNSRFAKGLESYEKGINQFSDYTYDEFSKIFNGATNVVKNSPKGRDVVDTLRGEARQLPASVDLRNTGFVGPIKNQGTCGYENE